MSDHVPVKEVFARLDRAVDESWALAYQSPFWRHTAEHGLEPMLGLLALVEQYHLVRHNSINQAIAVFPLAPEDDHLIKWCYRHAREELGHERMIIRDLQTYGLMDIAQAMIDHRPLPATQAFIGYLYHLGLTRGAVPRLGYSYWAERSYGRFDVLFERLKAPAGLNPREDFTFFKEHSAIDERHANEVDDVLANARLTPAQVDDIVDVVRTSIHLQNAILDNCLQEYRVRTGTLSLAGGEQPAA